MTAITPFEATDEQKVEYLEWYVMTMIDRKLGGQRVTEQDILAEEGPYGLQPSLTTLWNWFGNPKFAGQVQALLDQLDRILRVSVKKALLPGLENLIAIATYGKGLPAVQANRLLFELDAQMAPKNAQSPTSGRIQVIMERFRGSVAVAQQGADLYIALAEDAEVDVSALKSANLPGDSSQKHDRASENPGVISTDFANG